VSEPNDALGETRIAFIGAGNMASALFGGLIAKGWSAQLITAADPSATSLENAKALGVSTDQDNHRAIANADVVVLAVKPQALKAVLQDLRPTLAIRKPLLISIAAGIDLASLQHWAGPAIPTVRCMPNTPALVQTGATGLFANAHVTDPQRELTQIIMDAVGITLWLDSEAQLDAVTALSGSGPAYYFLVMEAMIEAGVALGLAPDVASKLTLQTALGAARMAQASDVQAAELRRRVTSPGGTTEQAMLQFEEGGLKPLFAKAMQRCAERSVELAQELGED
jgi:pyrroline-5-carboxylate reductase